MKLPTAIAAAALTLAATQVQAAPKPTIALVHGAFETATVWDPVIAKLKADGYPVINVNLPGRPGAERPISEVSLDLYKSTVLAAIAKAPGKVVLVGHSFGGVTISNVAEAAPEKIKTLVYVAAYVPQDGQSMIDMAKLDAGSQVGPHLQIQQDKGVASIEPAARGGLFANDADAGVQAAVAQALNDEPLAPLATPVHVTAARFGAVEKVYIHTAQDHVVGPAFQDAMAQAAHITRAETLNTGHTPFITNVPGLTAAIEKAAR